MRGAVRRPAIHDQTRHSRSTRHPRSSRSPVAAETGNCAVGRYVRPALDFPQPGLVPRGRRARPFRHRSAACPAPRVAPPATDGATPAAGAVRAGDPAGQGIRQGRECGGAGDADGRVVSDPVIPPEPRALHDRRSLRIPPLRAPRAPNGEAPACRTYRRLTARAGTAPPPLPARGGSPAPAPNAPHPARPTAGHSATPRPGRTRSAPDRSCRSGPARSRPAGG